MEEGTNRSEGTQRAILRPIPHLRIRKSILSHLPHNIPRICFCVFIVIFLMTSSQKRASGRHEILSNINILTSIDSIAPHPCPSIHPSPPYHGDNIRYELGVGLCNQATSLGDWRNQASAWCPDYTPLQFSRHRGMSLSKQYIYRCTDALCWKENFNKYDMKFTGQRPFQTRSTFNQKFQCRYIIRYQQVVSNSFKCYLQIGFAVGKKWRYSTILLSSHNK